MTAGSSGADVTKPPAPPDIDGAGIGDARAKFEQLTRETPHDPEALRAFIRHRIEWLRTAPGLSDEEREAEIAKLEESLPRR
jgi:hypothetical protein